VRSFLRGGATNSVHPIRLCLTFEWNHKSDETLRDTIANYTGIYKNKKNVTHDAMLAPQMIVVNPGLHPMFNGQTESDYVHDVKQVVSQMHQIATNQANRYLIPTRFVFHEITALVDAQMKWFKVETFNQTVAVRYNAALTACLAQTQRIDGASKWLRMFPAQRLTHYGLERGLIIPRGDGIHYDGGYNTIVTRMNLYFMNMSASSR
jgi:hypothetical protein